MAAAGLVEFSQVVHPACARRRVFAMMGAAYCDESADPRTFAVSGLMSELPELVELERRWRSALEKYHLTEFHASPCENQEGLFVGMDREARDRLQRAFIGIITSLQVWGFSAFIELEAHRMRRDIIERNRGTQFKDPYFLAFQMAIESMALQLEGKNFASDERIAFVFDQQKEYEGRAYQLYNLLLQSDVPLFKRRLGGCPSSC